MGILFFFFFISFIFLVILRKFFFFFKYYLFLLSICFYFFFLGFLFIFNTDTLAFQNLNCLFGHSFLLVGLDNISLALNLLTVFLFPLLFLSSLFQDRSSKILFFCLFSIEFFLIITFTSLDLFVFYIFFELILLPMLLLIIGLGSRSRKIKALFYFFFYTFGGSFFMLVGLICIYFLLGTTNILYLFNIILDLESEIFFFLFFFISFAIKIPMFPFYIWLPEAHVEAPTVGSVILAGLLLKLGSFGFLRILLPLFPSGGYFLLPFIFLLIVLSLFYSSLIILSQFDLKRIIAYSSIAHMNYAVLGFFLDSLESFVGGIFLSLSHGFTSSALFFLVGILYDRYHSRLLFYYNGLILFMPVFAFFFFIFTLANFGFPGLANFVGEFLIAINVLNFSEFFLFFLFLSLFLSLIYSILIYNRLFLGDFKIFFLRLTNYSDLTRREFYVCVPLFFAVIFWGLFSSGLEMLNSTYIFISFF